MITKGKITKIPTGKWITENGVEKYDNIYEVFIPIFLSAGQSKDSKLSPSSIEATLCYQPEHLNSYNVGDIVFVSFEDNDKSKPIILGKLYLGNGETESRTNDIVQDLRVTHNAKLPKNTTIGDISGDEIERLFRDVANNRYKIDESGGTTDAYTKEESDDKFATISDVYGNFYTREQADARFPTEAHVELLLNEKHLYEHNFVLANNADASSMGEILTFRLLSNNGEAFENSADIAQVLYSRGHNGVNNCLTAAGRYEDDSFSFITDVVVDFSEHDVDFSWGYCESYIIGVYGTNADELKVVISSLNEDGNPRIFTGLVSDSYLVDTVVEIF